MSLPIRVVQKVAIRKAPKYLILKKSAKARYYPNHWDFPGGKLEENEDPAGGIKREVREELDCELQFARPVFVCMEKQFDHYAFFVVYEGKLSGKIKLNPEHSEMLWATPKEMARLPMEYFLKKYLQFKSKKEKSK